MSSSTLDITFNNAGFISAIGDTVTGFFSSFGGVLALVIAIPLSLWLISIVYNAFMDSEYMVSRRDHLDAERLYMEYDEFISERAEAIARAKQKSIVGRRKEYFGELEKGYMERIRGRQEI